jgi:hypothetical protein
VLGPAFDPWCHKRSLKKTLTNNNNKSPKLNCYISKFWPYHIFNKEITPILHKLSHNFEGK